MYKYNKLSKSSFHRNLSTNFSNIIQAWHVSKGTSKQARQVSRNGESRPINYISPLVGDELDFAGAREALNFFVRVLSGT